MASRLERRAAALGRSVRVDLGQADRLPYADSSFDAVVVSFVLCSVSDAASTLSEVRRVVRPGGTFWFLEHVAAADPRVLQWQRRLNPIQRFLADGCELDRDTGAAIRAAGFAVTQIDEVEQADAPAITRHLIVGSAST
jgi:SAM-dependent methyltransferase